MTSSPWQLQRHAPTREEAETSYNMGVANFIHPPEMQVMEPAIKKVPKGKYILLPITEQTSGHGTHTNPTVWGDDLKELMRISEPEH